MAQRPRATDRFVAQNRRARHDFHILDTLEAGLTLVGSEVKSLRQGLASIQEAFAREVGGEIFLVNAFIPEYAGANRFNHEPKRPRKLLLHKRQVNKLMGQVKRDGITLVPLSVYFNDRGRAKLELGLAKGKNKADKRESDKQRDWNRDKARIMRNNGRN
jgi:SsrA-binding protein